MKKITVMLLSLILTLSVLGQESDANVEEMKEELENQKSDTTNIKFKRKTVKIVEDEEGTQIHVKKHDDDDDGLEWFWEDNNKFKGSWSSFSMGLSNFVDKDFSLSRSGDNQFMDLNTGKSWNMNVNFAQYSVGLIGEKFGLVTGLGLEWNYYRFDNDISIAENQLTGIIEERILDVDWNVEKSKLSTTYATLPLLLELHTSSSQDKGFVFSAGVVGGLKLGSNTKIVYKENGNKNKDKTKDDFNLSSFRYGVHARIGVGDWLVYGTYYFTPIFESNKGPELYPISVGIALSFE